jgi:hypothetical protein
MPITPAGRVSGDSTFGPNSTPALLKPEMRSMSLDEYVSQELDEFSESEGYTIINSGSLTLDGNPASKIAVGSNPSTPTGVFVYSINAIES